MRIKKHPVCRIKTHWVFGIAFFCFSLLFVTAQGPYNSLKSVGHIK